MNLMPYRPFDVFRHLDEDFGSLFSDTSKLSKEWTPRVDIIEEDSHYSLSLDVPGISPKDIEVTYEDGVLKIAGERKLEKKERDKSYHRVERLYGRFERLFKLPKGVDVNEIKASGKDGVLEIKVLKTKKEEPKKIEVK